MEVASLKIFSLMYNFNYLKNVFDAQIQYRHYKTKDFEGFAY